MPKGAWIYAQDADTGMPPLTAELVRSWQERGYALVRDLLPRCLLDAEVADAAAGFPEADTPAAEGFRDFGSGGAFVFPCASAAFNAVTLHPRLLESVAQLLDVEVEDLRLTQSDLWPKYARGGGAHGPRDNSDQRMHVDYPNHSLVHPPPWEAPEAVEVIIYLDDVETCGGATALVARCGPEDPAYGWPIVGTPGVAGRPYVNDRASAEAHLQDVEPGLAAWRAEQLYAREAYVHYAVGDVLLYRHDTWHRGTPLRAGRRLAHNLTFRRADAEWISTLQAGWAWAAYREDAALERTVADLTPAQLTVLGFPGLGHRYWNARTLHAVAARLEPYGFDIAPYERAVAERDGSSG